MTTRRRDNWTASDSEREMQKWTQSSSTVGPQLDPIVRETQESLSENMWFFLDNIAERCIRYNAALKNVAAHNPNNVLTAEEMKHATDIDEAPFLKIRLRRFVQVAEAEGDNEESPAAAEGTAKEDSRQGKEPAAKNTSVVTEEPTTGDDAKNVPTKENEEESDSDSDDDSDTYDAIDDIPVVFPKSGDLLDQMKHLKLAGTELVTVFEGICDWLQLSIPDIMVDDNDSVNVLQSVLEATNAHSEAVGSTVNFLREFLDDRADLEIDTIKFPHSSSLRRQMLINDLDAWSEVERGWRTLVRCSLIIHTLLAKNMRKLLNPRNSSRNTGGSLYQ
jgi:hypothetical protein